jgi:preprotein translocase subunit SecA
MIAFHPEPEPAFAGLAPAPAMASGGVAELDPAAPPMRNDAVDPNNPATWDQTPRNAPCPCGSGKKYKHCHGRIA